MHSYYFLFFKLNTVWVSCEGENPADVENIGPIQYIPRRGFPGYFFPFINNDGYLSPLVAVWFERPASKFKQNTSFLYFNSAIPQFLLLQVPSAKCSQSFSQVISGRWICSPPGDLSVFTSNFKSTFASHVYPLPSSNARLFAFFPSPNQELYLLLSLDEHLPS